MDRTAKVNMLLVHVSHLELHNHLVADLQSTTNDNNDPTTYPVIHRRIHWGKSIGVSIVVLMFMIAVIWHTFWPTVTSERRIDRSDLAFSFNKDLSSSVAPQAEFKQQPRRLDVESLSKKRSGLIRVHCTVQSVKREALRTALNHCIQEMQINTYSIDKRTLSFNLIKLGHYQLSSKQDGFFETGISVCIRHIEPIVSDPSELEIKCKTAR